VSVRAKFEGREALTRKLRQIVPEAEAEYAKAIEVGAKELAEAIRARAPRKTGTYAASIEAAKVAGRNNAQKPIGVQPTKDPNAWGIFANFYWRFLEFGTKAGVRGERSGVFGAKQQKTEGRKSYRTHPGSRAFPHVFPTFRAMRKRIRSRVTRSINKAVKKVAGK